MSVLQRCSPATTLCKQTSRCYVVRSASRAEAVRRNTRCGVFDGLKGFFGNIGKKQEAQAADLDDGDATMVRLDPEQMTGVDGGAEAVGPLAILMVGFMVDEVERFRSILLDMEADMVKLIPCTRKLEEGTLLQALESVYPQYEQPPLGMRRTMFLSGMFSSELVDVVAAYKEAGLPPCTFAAAVPNNLDRTVKDLVADVNQENQIMAQRVREAQARQQLEEQA